MPARRRSIRRLVGSIGAAAIMVLVGSLPSSAQTVTWTTQFGTGVSEWVADVASTGGVAYAVGGAHGRLPGSDQDGSIFVRAVSATDGSLIWSRQFGDEEHQMWLGGITADATGVYVAGQLWRTLPGQTSAGQQDAFVRRYDLAGNVVWTRQFGTARIDAASDVALGGGSLYVLGTTNDGLDGTNAGPNSGLNDLFVRRYDVAGNVEWTTQFGTPEWDVAAGIAADAGGVYVAGNTEGDFPWQPSPTRGAQVFVMRFGPNGGERWHRRIDGPNYDGAYSLAIGAGEPTVVGKSPGITGQRLFGSDNVFVRRYGSGGKVRWTRTFGSWAAGDIPDRVAVAPSATYIVGSTYGSYPGATNPGGTDAFVVALDPAGSLAWIDQFGSRDNDELNGAAVEAGALVVGGATRGSIEGLNRGGDDALLRGYAV